MAFNLRKRKPISYYELEEPNFDEYMFCDQCADYVYEYCALHGPLLVVPDDKIPVHTNFPSYVPRAALTIPHVFLHLAPSIIPGAGLGAFSTLTLPRGVRFGPYRGQRTQNVDSLYCWQIYGRNNKRSHVVDAVDGDRSNWMRYVNCARHWREQNLLAYQYKGQLYYRTIKIIPRFTELMVFYGSEFANALHINLSKYNSDKYYVESTPFVRHERIKENQSSNVLKENNNNHEEYLNIDQIEFIDEIREDKENNQSDTTIPEENSKTHDNKSCPKTKDTSSLQITCDGDEIKLTFNDNTKKIRHKCEICLKTFATTRSMKEHSFRHLNVWKYVCEYCDYGSNFKYRFTQHIGKHTNTYNFHCKICSYKTNYKRNFKAHCLRHERNDVNVVNKNKKKNRSYFSTPKICELCDFKTESRKIYSRHISLHKGNIYECDLCNYSNRLKYNLSRHILSKHLNN